VKLTTHRHRESRLLRGATSQVPPMSLSYISSPPNVFITDTRENTTLAFE